MRAKPRPLVPYVRQHGTAKNRTGRVGVSTLVRTEKNAKGVIVHRRFFVARMMVGGRPRSRPFCVDVLGAEVAFRAAVRCREGWERVVKHARHVVEPRRQELNKQWAQNYREEHRADQAAYRKRYYADPAKRTERRASDKAYRQRPGYNVGRRVRYAAGKRP